MSQQPWKTLAGSAWLLTWFSYLLLLGQQTADAIVYEAPWIIWLAKLVPLLMFLPGMLRDNARSYIWLCFVSLLYFISLVERAFAQPGNVLQIVGLFAVVVLFCSALMYVRWRARNR